MDRARNVEALEALAEEDDEEEVDDDKKNRDLTKESKEKATDQLPISNTKKKKLDSSDTDSSDDEEPDPAAQRDPNKFDNLCDGVLGAMALVHGSLRELLEMKDEMLKHALPPPLLIKMATITGKVFRSVSDLNMPVNELVRLVHVYSTPWEEKSTALKKLHEDYESKQRQLNIAIKRLQLVDAHSKRIAREKRIMNWEKLFAKIMSNKGHGRRWKFLIETIKQKAKLGLEHVQEYTKSLEESSGEEDEEEEEIPIALKRQGDNNSEKLSDLEEGEEEEGGGEESEKADSEGGDEDADPDAAFTVEESDDTTDAVTSRAGSSKKVRFAPLDGEEPPESPKVTTQEVSTWTEEPEYDSFLFVRVFAPQDLQEKEIKCRVSCGDQNQMTSRLDPEETAPAVEEKPKGKGLMGTKGKALEKKLEKKKKEEEKAARARYEELSFDLPEDVPEGVVVLGKKPNRPENLQIAVHCGPTEDLFAMATIEWDFIKTSIDPQIVYLPEPHGDDDVPSSPRAAGKSDVGDYDSHSVDVETTSQGDQRRKPAPPKPDLVKDAKPVSFPLFSVNPGKDVHDACGSLPLIIYIGKRLRPKVYNRQSETMTMNQLVFDLAGIDLDNWNKEDLNKEFREQASSVVGFPPEVKEVVVEKEVIKEVEIIKMKTPPPPPTPPKPETPPPPLPKEEEPQEEMVPKEEYEELIKKHNENLHMVQQEYEVRLQELMKNLQQMEQSRTEMQQQIQQQQQLHQQAFVQQRPASQHSSDSGGKRRHGAPGDKLSASTPSFDKIPQPPRSSPLRPATVPDQIPPPPIRPRKVVRPSKPSPFLGTGIPEDFLDRLQYFEEESNKHKMEMINKISQQIQSDIEKKLAGQHKLSKKEEEMYSALHDVSLPALFMPYKRGTVYNPRAHQYFHPTGSSDMRLSQPPSMFQLPPLPHKSKMSVLNLFELSRNFNARGQAWLMERYIQQQEPVANVHGMVPQTPAPTSAQNGSPEMAFQERQSGALHDTVQSIQGTSTRERELEVDM